MPFDSVNVESELTIALRRSFALINTYDRWCCCTNKRKTKEGMQFCTIGAVNEVVSYTRHRAFNIKVIKALYDEIPPEMINWDTPRNSVMDYNDSIDFEEMTKWWARTIERSVERDALAMR